MFVPNRELGDFLLDARLVTRAQLESITRAAEESGKSLHEILREESLVPEDDLRRAVAHTLGVPFTLADLGEIEEEAVMLVPEPLARSHSLAGFRLSNGTLHILLLDTDDLSALAFLEDEKHLRLVPHLTDRASLKRVLILEQKLLREKYAGRLKNTDGAEVVDALLSHALLSHAREIHLSPREGTADLLVRYRIGNSFHDAMLLPRQSTLVIGRLKSLANLSFTLHVPQEGSFKAVLQNKETLRVRVATLHVQGGERVTLHLTPEHLGARGFTLEALGLHGDTLEAMHDALSARSGLILVAAPREGGKSTTMYTLADMLGTPLRLVIAVEEKTRLRLPQITQVEVRADLGLTIASTARAALKQHPDILFIEEITDIELAILAVSAASRGTLVVAGIKAPSAAKAIHKLASLDVPPRVLASVLRAAVATRAVRRLCPHCKEVYTLTRAEATSLEAHANFGRVLSALKAENIVGETMQWKEVTCFKAVGCEKCDGGYSGMIGLQEVLPTSAITKEHIIEEASAADIEKSAEIPLNLAEDGVFKAVQGFTTIEEVKAALD